MSVFQLHDYWSTKAGNDEEYDIGCMAIGNLDNSNPAADKIVVGSQTGMLRVYCPTKADYRVEDLIHEEDVGIPILQIAVGRFLPNSPNIQALAVLHPRKLTVFEFLPNGNAGGKAAYYTLTKVYDHHLGMDGKHFTAFNMLYGPFGGTTGKDLIMVQSMDGKLQFFDQSAEAFSRQIVDCLLPGCCLYLPRMDAFVTCNHANRVECYRYHVLVNTQAEIGEDSKTSGRTAYGLTAVRSAMVEWSINVGETCMQMMDGKFISMGGGGPGETGTDRAGTQILVLTERSLFLIKDTGSIIQQRRLEKEPSCLHAFQGGVGLGHNFILANRDFTLQVFQEFQLVWAVMLPYMPVQVAVCNLAGQKGLILSIGDEGQLTMGYLGTKPPVAAIGGVKRDLDYDKIEGEHRKLLQVIRDLQSDHNGESNDSLTIRAQVPRVLDRNNTEDSLGVRVPEDAVRLSVGALGDHLIKVSVRVFVTYSGTSAASNVSVAVTSPPHVHCIPSTIYLHKVAGVSATPTILNITFIANRSFLPTGNDAIISATYKTPNGEPRICSHTITLPLALSCKLRPPSKTAPYKLTLDTEHGPQPLNELFSDFVQSCAESAGGSDLGDVLDASGGSMALGFQFWATPAFTPIEEAQVQASSGSIIVSKAGGRYRVQADSLAGLYLLTAELFRRLTIRLREIQSAGNGGSGGPPKFSMVTFAENIPLEYYFPVITEHHQMRQRLQDSLAKLNDIAHQFRMVEKRLLARFKDRTPSPLNGLDVIMRESYDGVMSLGQHVSELQSSIKRLAMELESGSKLVALLCFLKFQLSPMEHQQLESYLCPDLDESAEQGWEEVVEASLTFLLKTALAKNAKESAVISQQLEMSDNVEKLKKHIAMVLDRLGKGARLIKLKSAAPAGSSGGGESKNSRK